MCLFYKKQNTVSDWLHDLTKTVYRRLSSHMLSQSLIVVMYTTLFYCIHFTTLITEHIHAHEDQVPDTCQSLGAESPKYEGRCDCFQLLLEMRCENLTHVPSFAGFNCVFVGVYMAKQSIRQLEENAFAHLPTRRLVLDFNDIEDRLHVAAFSGNFSDIVQELYLGACRLRNLPPGLFDDMHNLIVLHLWHNNIQHLPARVFVGCDSLRELVLSHNTIASVDENTFTGLRRLRKLDLDFNRISLLSRDVFKELTNLEVTLCIFTFTSVLLYLYFCTFIYFFRCCYCVIFVFFYRDR